MSVAVSRGEEQPERPCGSLSREPSIHAFRDDALGDHDAVAITELITSGEITVREVIEAAIARAEDAAPELGAFAWADMSGAREQASRLTGAAPFRGVPTVIKDNVDVAGIPTRQGSAAVPGRPATNSSAFVEQYLSMGFVHLGKSALPEFGLTATTEPASAGPTRNPWNPAHSAGGSSGGSAVLVAAGVVPIAHGNDGGGSIRIPASCCGLVGLKPSRGRIIDEPELDKAPVNLVCQGVLTRSVRDTARYMRVAEGMHQNRDLAPVGLVTGPGTERLRIGFFTRAPGGADSETEVVSAVEEMARLCEELGHQVERIDNPFNAQMADDFLLYWALAAQAIMLAGRQAIGQPVDRQRVEPLTSALGKHFRRRLHRIPGAIRQLRRFSNEHDRLFEKHDLLLSPTLARAPVPIGVLGPDVPGDEVIERLRSYVGFTPAQNVSGAPGISLPGGVGDAGVPLGIHFGARVGAERVLLELAFEIEEANPFPRVGD